MSRREAFERQRIQRAAMKARHHLRVAADPHDVRSLLDEASNEEAENRFRWLPEAPEPQGGVDAEVERLLAELDQAFESSRLEQLFDKTGREILQAIAVPFGLGKVLSVYDRTGGNVDTIHNVRQGIYATEAERETYESRGEYDAYPVHSDPAYIDANRRRSAARDEGKGQDAYSGAKLGARDRVDQDHVVSAKQTHDDPGRVLAEVDTPTLANLEENLVETHRSINRSKKARSPEEFAQYLESTAEQRKARIRQLQGGGELSKQEEKELAKLQRLDAVDTAAVRAHGEAAQAAQDRVLNAEYYRSRKFVTATAQTSAREGVRMGIQQAFGLILVELFAGIVDEVRDVFRNGRIGETLFEDLRLRIGRVADSVSARWGDAVTGFRDGFAAGFISNIATTVINALVTTGARTVRMIREGTFSLLRALKMMVLPPEGMSPRVAAHEGLKLLAAGGIVVAGVALEESINGVITAIPPLRAVASVITGAVVGGIAAIAMAISAYLMDKLDLLGAMKEQRDAFVTDQLDRNIHERLAACDRLLAAIDNIEIVSACPA